METVIEGLTGPAAGSRVEITEGTTATFGRADKAKVAIARDDKLADLHFEIGSAGGRCLIRTGEGDHATHLNGRRIAKQADLRNGDVISAGASTFRVRLLIPEVWTDLTPNEQALLAMLYGPVANPTGERVYAVLDAGRDDRIPAFLQACDAEHASLFEGYGSRELRGVAPYIACVPNGSKILRLILKHGWGNSWGIFLTSHTGMRELRAHFQRFLTMQDKNGKLFLYRFYDPRVLRTALPASAPADRNRFFGPVARFVLEDDKGIPIEMRGAPQPIPARQQAMLPGA